jgi:pullulanase/glycogen debranching enzyme
MTDHAASLSVEVLPGEALPPGASWDGRGTNFSLFSEHAEGVELCLFDDDGAETRLALSEIRRFIGTAICRVSARGGGSATTSSRTTKSTARPTSRTTATATTRTGPGTAASRVPPTTQGSSS